MEILSRLSLHYSKSEDKNHSVAVSSYQVSLDTLPACQSKLFLRSAVFADDTYIITVMVGLPCSGHAEPDVFVWYLHGFIRHNLL